MMYSAKTVGVNLHSHTCTKIKSMFVACYTIRIYIYTHTHASLHPTVFFLYLGQTVNLALAGWITSATKLSATFLNI